MIKFAAKTNHFYLLVGTTCSPTLQPLPPLGQQPHLPSLPHLSPVLPTSQESKGAPSHSPLKPSLHFFQNPSSSEGLGVSMWYHCDHKLISRFCCLLVFFVEAQGTPEFFDFPPFPPSPGGPQPWQSTLGKSSRLLMAWIRIWLVKIQIWS